MLIVLWMIQAGLRCCEIERLQIGDIDRGRRMARLTGKAGHERFVWLPDELEDALNAYLREYPASSGPLIRSYRRPNMPLRADTISGMVTQWMWEAGIKVAARDGVSAHAGRHTAATDMLLNGASARDVQYVLGHAHLATTERYLPPEVRGIVAAMDGRRYQGELA
jgi:integrase/recombinase XerC